MTTITMNRKQPMKTGCDCENEATSQGNIYKDVILRELSTVVLLKKLSDKGSCGSHVMMKATKPFRNKTCKLAKLQGGLAQSVSIPTNKSGAMIFEMLNEALVIA